MITKKYPDGTYSCQHGTMLTFGKTRAKAMANMFRFIKEMAQAHRVPI